MSEYLKSSIETLSDGTRVLVRPIRASDLELERRFIESLSASARRFRFLATFNSPSDALLHKLTDIDPSQEAALVALTSDGAPVREVGVARLCADSHGGGAEIAVTVDDHWQGRGLATLLMKQLIALARERGIRRLYSIDSSENKPMQELAAHLGFRRKRDLNDATLVEHFLDL